jgi:ATP-dependent exoDNAse (exonuclease V) beta subunit
MKTADVGGDGDACRRAFSILARLHVAAVSQPPSAIVRQLFDLTRVIPLHALKPDGERRMANLLKLLDMALSWEEAAAGLGAGTGFPALREFVAWIEEQREAAAEEESPLAAEGEAAVNIMTIHGAKGLEFPVVAILDRAYQPGFRDRAIPDREHGTVHLSVTGLQPVEWEERREAERVQQEAEALRLQYVAFTRARDHVVMASSRTGPEPEKTFLAPLEKALRHLADTSSGDAGAESSEKEPRSLVEWMVTETPERKSEFPHRLPRSFHEPSGAEIAAASARREADLSDWKEVVARARRSVMLRSSRLDGFGVRHPGPAGEEGTPGTIFAGGEDAGSTWYARLRGTRVHEAMELVVGFGYGIDDACRAVTDPGDPADLVAELPGLVEQGGVLLEQARAEGWRVVGVECPLLMGDPAAALPDTIPAGIEVLTGTADLVLADAGGNLRVVDYKTGRAEATTLREHYRAQLEAYAVLLREATARTVEAEIWALSTGERVPVQDQG